MQHCRCISDEALRKSMVEQLPQDIAQGIRNSERERTHALNFLTECARYPEGLDELVAAMDLVEGYSSEVQYFEKYVQKVRPGIVDPAHLAVLREIVRRATFTHSVLRQAYDASAPDGPEWSRPPERDETALCIRMLKRLNKAVKTQEGTFPLLMFVEHLAVQTQEERQELRDWNESVARLLGAEMLATTQKFRSKLISTDITAIRPPVPNIDISMRPYLLVKLVPRSSQNVNAQAWLFCYQDQTRHEDMQLKDALFQTPSEAFDTILQRCHERLFTLEIRATPIIEVFLPFTSLCDDINSWTINYLNYRIPINQRYPLVLRSLDRINAFMSHENYEMLNFWQGKWQLFEKSVTNTPTISNRQQYFTERECQSRRFIVNEAQKIFFLPLAFVPATPVSLNQPHVFSTIIKGGIPIAFWPRQAVKHLSERDLKHGLKSILAGCDFSRLPEALSEKCKEKADEEQHLVHHLTLLWDDPNRIPPLIPVVNMQKYRESTQRDKKYS